MVVCSVGGKKWGLGGLGHTAGAVGLGAFAGKAFAVQSGFGHEVKGVRGESEFMLRDGQAVFAAFHSGFQAAQ